MTQEAPAGYVTMRADLIDLGASNAIAKRKKDHQQWLNELPVKLLEWRNRKGLLARFDMWGKPKDVDGLVQWYLGHAYFNAPNIPGIESEPQDPRFHLDWRKRVKDLPPDTMVFIAVDDAAALRSWLQ